MQLALEPEGSTVGRISESYGISKNHLVKVVHRLGQLGYIRTVRGKSGGLYLAHAPEDINIADVVRDMEPNFAIVECLQEEGGTCPIAPVCALKGAVVRAQQAFMDVLHEYTLYDCVQNSSELGALLQLQEK